MITSVGAACADFSAIDYALFLVSVQRGYLFHLVLVIDCHLFAPLSVPSMNNYFSFVNRNVHKSEI